MVSATLGGLGRQCYSWWTWWSVPLLVDLVVSATLAGLSGQCHSSWTCRSVLLLVDLEVSATRGWLIHLLATSPPSPQRWCVCV